MRYLRNLLLMAALIAGFSDRAVGAEDIGSQWVRMMKKGHPRLILPDEQVAELRKTLQRDPVVGGWYDHVRASAEGLLKAGPIGYDRGDRGNMLGSCRQAVDRIYCLGLVYRIEGDKRFARRAVDELMRAAGLDSWDPGHFLDTAELTHAVAIGYDWFFREMTPAQRKTLREAIVHRGLEESLVFYETSMPVVMRLMYFNWAVCNHNWSQVCNGGMIVGALAIADEEPQLAAKILTYAMSSIRRPMAEFEPDGGWAEGPGYWRYATSYTVYGLSALETAVGPSAIQSFLAKPGFEKTGYFGIHMVGPLNLTFNFADAHEEMGEAPQLFWLATKFKKPVYACRAQQLPAACPEDILWYRGKFKTPQQAGLPLDAFFPNVDVMFFRSNWADRNAVYVGFKGGYNGANHSHLDLGTFVLDADGHRWAMDLGSDRYSLPGYFDKGKKQYYRLTSAGHNVPIINGKPQSETARANTLAFSSRPGQAFGVVDLSKAYGEAPGRVLRGVSLIRRRQVLVQDELNLSKESEVTWQMHTRAEVDIKGRSATLRQGDASLQARILEPDGAAFEIQSASPAPPENPNTGVRKLVVRLRTSPRPMRIVVLLSPGKGATVPELRPLSRWIEEGKTTSGSGRSPEKEDRP